MPGGIADFNDSLLGWASQAELELTQKLGAVEYFPQTQLRSDELERIDRFYGTFLSRQLAAGGNLEELLDMTPGLTVASLVSRATDVVDPENFFSEYFGGLGLGMGSGDESAEVLAAGVEKLVAKVGLAVPAGSNSALDILTVHAGVVASEVHAVIDGAPAPMFETCKRLAPQWAESIEQGIRELSAFTQEHPTSWPDRERDLTLPRIIDEKIVAELRERPVGTENRESAVGVSMRELRPRLVLDAKRKKVCLRLPEQRVNDGEVTWRVSLEGTTHIFRTGRAWGDTSGYSEALDITLERQVREITVTDTTNGITWVVPGVDFNDPVLVFSAYGQDLTDKVSLHHPEIHVLAPTGSTLMDMVTGEELAVLNSFEVEGWASWTCSLVDARAAASLKVNGEVRCIDPRQRATFRHPDARVHNVRSHSGLQVYSESLIAEFPPTMSGRDETWWLSISAYAGLGGVGEEIADPEPLEVPASGGIFAIFDPEAYDAPWVGEYLVRLRGPRNESFRHQFAIVEGMNVSMQVDGASSLFRIPTTAGLSEAILHVRAGEKPFTASPKRVGVPAGEPGAGFVVTTDEGDQMPLQFAPPQLTIEIPLTTEPPMWRGTRVVCGPRELDGSAELRIRTGVKVGDPRVTVRNHHGSPVRSVKLSSPDGDRTYTAPMKDIAASTFVMPRGSIEFEWTDFGADRRVSVTVAVIDSAPHATSISIDDGVLVFEDLAADRNLAAWVWTATAPWTQAHTIAVTGSRVELPEALVNAGSLIVQPHCADPFMTLRAPLSPGISAMTAEQPGYFSEQPEAFAALSAFFGGEAEEPPTDGSIMPALWDVSYIWSSRGQSDHLPVVHAALQANPQGALKGLSESLVPAAAQPGRVISSGLTGKPFIGPEEASEVHRTAWIGTLELLGKLPEVYAAYEQGGTREALAGVLRQLEQVAGKNLLDTLATGRDSTLDTACIDQSTVAIAGMNEAQQAQLLDMFFSNAEIVPGPLMGDNARLLAVFETFKKRDEVRNILASEGLIKTAVDLLRALRGAHRHLYSSARIRFDKLEGVNTDSHENIWALAPVVSLVFALSSRLHAHEMMGKSRTLEKASTGWSQLASLVPDLVTGDLISAEAMVLAVKHPGIVD